VLKVSDITYFLLVVLRFTDFRFLGFLAKSKAIATFCLLVRLRPAFVVLLDNSLILADMVFCDLPLFNGILLIPSS